MMTFVCNFMSERNMANLTTLLGHQRQQMIYGYVLITFEVLLGLLKIKYEHKTQLQLSIIVFESTNFSCRVWVYPNRLEL